MSSMTTEPAATTMPGEALVSAFAGAMAGRDLAGAAALLSDEVRVRALLPRGCVVWQGIPETMDHFEFWFGRFLATWGESLPVSHIGERYVTGWRHDGSYTDGTGRHVIEQHAAIGVGSDGIDHLDLLCSGFWEVIEPRGLPVECWDSGDLGCSDGLPSQFRRRIAQVADGALLEVTVRDPAAKQDLPPIARMLGHTVEGVTEPGDGRLVFAIRKADTSTTESDQSRRSPK